MDGLSEVFQALAHDRRREMIHALALRPHSISDLAAQQRLSLPAIHKHIRALEDAGLVRRRKTGRTTFLALRREPLGRLQDWVGQFHPEWGTDQESLANYADHLEHHPTDPKEPA